MKIPAFLDLDNEGVDYALESSDLIVGAIGLGVIAIIIAIVSVL